MVIAWIAFAIGLRRANVRSLDVSLALSRKTISLCMDWNQISSAKIHKKFFILFKNHILATCFRLVCKMRFFTNEALKVPHIHLSQNFKK